MKVFVTRKVPGKGLEELQKNGFEVNIHPYDRPVTSEELASGVKGVDAIVSLLTERIDGDLMDLAGPQLKIIANYAVGFDNIDVKEATNRGIVVVNTPSEEVNEAVAEHTWALILSLARRIVEADESTRRGGYSGWDPGLFLGVGLRKKNLGIVGMGRIGSMVAQRARGYQMNVFYNKRSRDEEAEKSLGVKFLSLEELYEKSDFITLHVPLSDETRWMINKDVFSKMKRGSYLINTARGQVVKEDDLVEALKEGILKGAALDVFENEPHLHPELLTMQNVILTPHIGSATWEAREKMCKMVVDALIDLFRAKKPQGIVNEEVWENRRK